MSCPFAISGLLNVQPRLQENDGFFLTLAPRNRATTGAPTEQQLAHRDNGKQIGAAL
jgi:hypothetical protein